MTFGGESPKTKVEYSEPEPCTERLATKRATRDEAMAKNKATAGDFIQQLVAPYLNAEGDTAKKCGKELDSMIAAWKLLRSSLGGDNVLLQFRPFSEFARSSHI